MPMSARIIRISFIFPSFDVANIFRGRISGKQLFKNMAGTAATVGGGTGGWIAGAAAGSAILPGVGTVIGGIAGSLLAGAAAGKATNAVIGTFIEDDADEMVEIIQNVFTDMASEYLLSNKEAEKMSTLIFTASFSILVTVHMMPLVKYQITKLWIIV